MNSFQHVVTTQSYIIKGNIFKNKRVLVESIHKAKAEKAREKTLPDQFEAKSTKNKASREKENCSEGGEVGPSEFHKCIEKLFSCECSVFVFSWLLLLRIKCINNIFGEIGNEEFDQCPLLFVKCLGSSRKSISCAPSVIA